MSSRRRRTAVIAAVFSALAFVTSSCGGSSDVQPTASDAAVSPSAPPSSAAEPPYSTELDLSAEEKEAADAAYGVLVSFIEAYNQVGADSGKDPERALRFSSGDVEDEYRDSFSHFEREGGKIIGGVKHKFHKLSDVSLPRSESDGGAVEFTSCVDFSDFDVVDSRGRSQAGDDTSPFIAVYTVSEVSPDDWRFSELENTDEAC